MPDRPLHLFIVAGEASGDALGGRLMAALKAVRPGRDLHFSGIGGPAMREQGLESLFPMAELSLLGLVEVLPRARSVLRRIRQTADQIVATRPDLVVTIDAQAFSMRLARRLRGHGILHAQYVAPTVWAWRPGRAKKAARLLDLLLALFPFEPPYFARHGLATVFVGHSVVEAAPEPAALAAAAHALRRRLGIAAGRPCLVVLPGSRTGEIRRLGAVFGEALGLLKSRFPNLVAVVPTVPQVAALVRPLAESWPVPAHVLEDVADKFPAMAGADAALAASGSVALELAVAGTPMAIAYRANPVSALVFRLMAKVRFVNLINIMEDRAVVPELLQGALTAPALARAVGHVMTDAAARRDQMEAMARVTAALGRGGPPPSRRAAEALWQMLERKS